jgi:DNA repair protein RecN (Recombination protein N)
MLTELKINNFVLIDKFEGAFKSGMTTITGETGAGKSIILGALSLLLGARCESKFFKENEGKIDLLAEFTIDDNINAKRFLQSKDFHDEDNTCVLRRILTKDGKNKSYINNIACTASDLKNLGETLIEIHSQHKNQELLSVENQISLIDAYSETKINVDKLNQLYISFVEKDKSLKEILKKKDEEQSKLQMLTYKYNELKELSIEEDEIKSLEDELKMLTEAEETINLCYESVELCSSSDVSLDAIISKLKSNISGLNDDRENIKSILVMLDEMEINSQEISSSLSQESEDYSIDPDRQVEVSNRLDKAYSIAKKNFILPEQLYSKTKELEEELKSLNVSDEDIDFMHSELSAIKGDWLSIAKNVSKIRIQKSKSLAKEVSHAINELKMEGSVFEIQVKSNEQMEINPKGIDEVQFLLSSNLGQTLKPIKSVASGGELSRISLSLHSIISKHYDVPTLVFDEVDVGIGGTTANIIGKYLKRISKHSQVLCITHLPQVTVHGDSYLTVIKKNQSNKTIVNIKYITEYELVTEIGRMLGNEILDGEAIGQAKKMIHEAKEISL